MNYSNMTKNELINRISGMENTMRQLEKKVDLLLNSRFTGIALLSDSGIIQYANKIYAQRLQTSQDDLIGKYFWQNKAENSSIDKAEIFNNLMAHKQPVWFSDEYNGIIIDTRMYPVFKEDGTVEHIVINNWELPSDKIDSQEYKEKNNGMFFEKLFRNMDNVLVLNKVVYGKNNEPADLKFIEVNKAYERMVGKKAEDIIGRTLLEIDPDIVKDTLNVVEFYGNIAISGKETRIESYSESYSKWFSVLAYSPEIDYVIVMIEDITERKIIEETLRKKEFLLSESEQIAKIGSWEWDIGKDEITTSQGYKNILGYENDHIQSMKSALLANVNEEDKPILLKSIDQTLNHNKPFDMEYRVIRQDNAERVMWTKAKVFRNPDGSPETFIGFNQDITERKKNHEIMTQTLNELNTILNTTIVGIVYVKSNKIVWVNKKAEELSGYSKDELIGIGILQFIYLSEHEYFIRMKEADHILAKGLSYSIETRIKQKNGNLIWCSISGKSIDNTDITKGSIWVLEDITEKKIAEEELKHRVDFEMLISEVSSRFVKFAIDNFEYEVNNALKSIGKFIDVDRCFIYLYDEEEQTCTITYEWHYQGKSMVDENQKSMPVSLFSWSWKKMKKSEIIHISNIEKLPEKASGERKLLKKYGIKSFVNVPLFYRNKLIGTLGISTLKEEKIVTKEDIILLRNLADIFVHAIVHMQSEKEIRNSEARLHSVVQNMPVMLHVMDENRKIIIWNRECEKVTQFSEKEIKGNPKIFQKLFAEKGFIDRLNLILNKKSGDFRHLETEIICRNGERKVISWSNISSSTPIPGWATWTIGIEVTDLRHTELLLKEALADAKTAEKLKSAFLANMSHEIRTPLNAIIGFVELLLMDKKLPRRLKLDLKYIKENSHMLLSIINDILDLSKMEAGHVKIKKNKCSLKIILAYVESNAYGLLPVFDSKAEIKQNYPDNINDTFISDPTRLQQVLINLLSNAIKFTHDGEIEFGVFVQDEKKLVFYVRDTGIGIPRKYHEEIFKPFNQGSHFISQRYGGTGLGLAINKRIIQLMKGEMWFESKEGKGSTFYVSIPYIPG